MLHSLVYVSKFFKMKFNYFAVFEDLLFLILYEVIFYVIFSY